METISYSWLAATATAPLVIIFTAWNLTVFRKYRSMWNLVDLFLISLSSQEVASSLFAFGFAVLNLIQPALKPPCSFIVWGLIATRVFQLSVLTSLLLHWVLTIKRPYTYRLSVRRNQLRYHVVALSVISLFVGMTAVFARIPNGINGVCSIHPLAWDVKFSVFLTSVYCVLLLVGITCCLMAHIGRTESRKKCPSATTSRESKRSASTSNSSQQVHVEHAPSHDVEWKVITCAAWLSLVTNHGPFLVMTITGIVMPTFWSPWLDNITVWMRLFQGASFPLALLLTDPPHRNALRTMLRQPGRIYRYLPDYRVFQKSTNSSDVKPDVLPSLMFNQRNSFKSFRFPVLLSNRLRWKTNPLASLASLNAKTGAQRRRHFQPLSINTFNHWNTDTLDSHTYISVDSCYTASQNSMDSDQLDYFFDPVEDSRSITTDAIDDFEYMTGISDSVMKFSRRPMGQEQLHRTSSPLRCSHLKKYFSMTKGHLPASIPNIVRGNESDEQPFAIPRSKMPNARASMPGKHLLESSFAKENGAVNAYQVDPYNNQPIPLDYDMKEISQYRDYGTCNSSNYVPTICSDMPIFTVGEITELDRIAKGNCGNGLKDAKEKDFTEDDFPIKDYLNSHDTYSNAMSSDSLASISNLKTSLSTSTLSSLDSVHVYPQTPLDQPIPQRIIFSGYL